MDQDDATADSQALWQEWGRLTRFTESARLAFARERDLWESLEMAAAHAEVMLTAPAGQGVYRVSLKAHLDAINHEETLLASVLIHTYALAEAAAAKKLGHERSTGGIEGWSDALLNAHGLNWSAVLDGKAGLVEAAVIRDAYAHGTRTLDQAASDRLAHAGAPQRPAGTAATLTYDDLRLYRDRLRSLLPCTGFNIPEAARA